MNRRIYREEAEQPQPGGALENGHPRAEGAFRVIGAGDHEAWLGVLGRVVRHDFHHLPQYYRAEERRVRATAHLFTCARGEHVIALPLLLRPVDGAGGTGWMDATSAYGFGGPLTSHEVMPQDVVREFQTGLEQALAERQVVAAFSSLHPLIPHRVLDGLGECSLNGQTVSIDLTLPDAEQWAQYRNSYQRCIKKLARRGIVCVQDHEKRYLTDFVSTYHETMRRVNARSSYYFTETYFDELIREMGGMLELFVVIVGGRVAAASLVTACHGIVQDYLGGTRDEFLKLSPDRLILDTVRRWASGMGARVYHLGGGVGAKEDSLFQYKAGFSDRRHPFATWRWVIMPEVYRELCETHTQAKGLRGIEPAPTAYFPAYRCPETTPAGQAMPAAPVSSR